jgi:thiamine biosynthesis lipoprotein
MGAGIVAGVALLASLSGAPEPARYQARGRHLMGTRLLVETEGGGDAAIEAAFDEVARLEQVLSNWRADSELSRLNAGAADGPVRCSPDLFAAVGAALAWAERTSGAFDPTVEPLVRRLGLRDPADRLPGFSPPADADDASPVVGWRLVRLGTGREVRFTRPGVGLDFGGIGKGIALDAAARVLAAKGAVRARLDFGGQVLFAGRAPAGGWRLDLSDPSDRARALDVLSVRGGSVSTSGNQERSVRGASAPIGHILDPRTGRPALFAGSVTVRADDATSADALSTALFVMGPERGLRWAAEQGIDVLFLSRDGRGALVLEGTGAFATVQASR